MLLKAYRKTISTRISAYANSLIFKRCFHRRNWIPKVEEHSIFYQAIAHFFANRVLTISAYFALPFSNFNSFSASYRIPKWKANPKDKNPHTHDCIKRHIRNFIINMPRIRPTVWSQPRDINMQQSVGHVATWNPSPSVKYDSNSDSEPESGQVAFFRLWPQSWH